MEPADHKLNIQANVNLSDHTTLKIGGPAKSFSIAHTQQELIDLINYANSHQLSYLVVGGGSNLLVADQGIDSLVIKNSITGIKTENSTVIIQSGTVLQELVSQTIEQSLAGLERLTGIPGTVGGAVYGNAGAYGQAISDYLTKVICYDGEKLVELNKEECGFDYRSSIFKTKPLAILEVHFQLHATDKEALKKESAEVLAKRTVNFPPTLCCPGSFFKNIIATNLPDQTLNLIPKDKIVYNKIPAGYLLEAVGAKGAQKGQIQVSPRHGNLFINLGHGSAEDFYTLAKENAEKVQQKFNIKMEPEVQLIGLPPLWS